MLHEALQFVFDFCNRIGMMKVYASVRTMFLEGTVNNLIAAESLIHELLINIPTFGDDSSGASDEENGPVENGVNVHVNNFIYKLFFKFWLFIFIFGLFIG